MLRWLQKTKRLIRMGGALLFGLFLASQFLRLGGNDILIDLFCADYEALHSFTGKMVGKIKKLMKLCRNGELARSAIGVRGIPCSTFSVRQELINFCKDLLSAVVPAAHAGESHVSRLFCNCFGC